MPIAAEPGFSPGHGFAAVVAAAGVALLIAVAALSHEERRGLSAPIVYLAVGAAGSVLLGLLGIARIDPVGDALVVERITEFALILALFATGLRVHPELSWRRWRPALALLVVGLPLTVLAGAVLGATLVALPVGAAILLAAALAPTDPVLAGDIGVSPPGSEDEEERGLPHGRFTLTSEAGLNDGLVLPLFLVGVFVVERGGLHWLGRWALADLLYGIAVALAAGWLAGRALGAVLLPLHDRDVLAAGAEHFVAAAAAVCIYGAVELADGYGFVAVFVAGIAFRRVEYGHEYNRQLHDGAALLMRFGELVVVILLGSMLTFDGLGAPGLAGWALAVLALVAIRPLVSLLCLVGTRMPRRERALVSWFGVRGVATLNYAAVAVTDHALHGAVARQVVWTALAVVVLSIVLHSLTALPVNRRYAAGGG